jgi:hypothetical protein
LVDGEGTKTVVAGVFEYVSVTERECVRERTNIGWPC